ncbi:hypothetical protein D3C87_1286990 [compost metagenome]
MATSSTMTITPIQSSIRGEMRNSLSRASSAASGMTTESTTCCGTASRRASLSCTISPGLRSGPSGHCGRCGIFLIIYVRTSCEASGDYANSGLSRHNFGRAGDRISPARPRARLAALVARCGAGIRIVRYSAILVAGVRPRTTPRPRSTDAQTMPSSAVTTAPLMKREASDASSSSRPSRSSGWPSRLRGSIWISFWPASLSQ